MNKKNVTEALSKKIELINIKVREINERRRGLKVTRIEDDLDRQELNNYARFLGLEQGSVSLESAEAEVAPRNNVFYVTLAIEAIIELLLVYFTAAILLGPAPGTMDYIMAALLMGMFAYLGYTIAKALHNK